MSVTRSGDGTVELALQGVIDAASAPLLRQELSRLHEEGERRVVLDLADVFFVDSAGLGVLVSALKRYTCDGGALGVRRPRRHVARFFEMTGVSDIMGLDGHGLEGRAGTQPK